MSLLFVGLLLPLIMSLLLFLTGMVLREKHTQRQRGTSVMPYWGVVSLFSAVGVFAFVHLEFTQHDGFQAGSTLLQSLWQWLPETQGMRQITSHVGFLWDGLSSVLVLASLFVGALFALFSMSTAFSSLQQQVSLPSRLSRMGLLNCLFAVLALYLLADNMVLWVVSSFALTFLHYAACQLYRQGSDVASRWSYWHLAWLLIADMLLLVASYGLYERFGSVWLTDLLNALHAQEGVPDSALNVPTALLVLYVMIKSALLPVFSWLTQDKLPTWFSLFVHTVLMLVPSLYVLLRFYGLFAMHVELVSFLSLLGGLSAVVFALAALAVTQLAFVYRLICMSQVGLMLLLASSGAWQVMAWQGLSTLLVLVLLLMVFASCEAHTQRKTIYAIRLRKQKLPLLTAAFAVSFSGLLSLPWLSGRFFSQHAALWDLWLLPSKGYYVLGLVAIFCMSLCLSRLAYVMFFRVVTPQPDQNQVKDASKLAAAPIQQFGFSMPYVTAMFLCIILSLPLYYVLQPSFEQVLPLSQGQLVFQQHPEKLLQYYLAAYVGAGMVLLGMACSYGHYMLNWGSQSVQRGIGFFRSVAQQNLGIPRALELFVFTPIHGLSRLLQNDPLRKTFAVMYPVATFAQRMYGTVSKLHVFINERTALLLVVTVCVVFTYIVML